MKDVIERFLVLPISMGCISKSTTSAVESTKWKAQNPQPKHHITRIQDGKRSSGVKFKNSWEIVSRSSISRGIQRLILKTFQRFSRILKYKDVEEIEMERELEIGYPTDVKHVTHIGYDGSMTTNPVKNWENIETPEIHSFPSISLKQFEHAMAAQSEIPLMNEDVGTIASHKLIETEQWLSEVPVLICVPPISSRKTVFRDGDCDNMNHLGDGLPEELDLGFEDDVCNRFNSNNSQRS